MNQIYDGREMDPAVTKRAVDQMNGSIEMKTEKREGSPGTVQLLGPKSPSAGHCGLTNGQGPSPGRSGQKERPVYWRAHQADTSIPSLLMVSVYLVRSQNPIGVTSCLLTKILTFRRGECEQLRSITSWVVPGTLQEGGSGTSVPQHVARDLSVCARAASGVRPINRLDPPWKEKRP